MVYMPVYYGSIRIGYELFGDQDVKTLSALNLLFLDGLGSVDIQKRVILCGKSPMY